METSLNYYVHSDKEMKEGGDETTGPQPEESSTSHQAADKEVADGKIVFKRPEKRRRSSEGVLDASTKKPKEGEKNRKTRKGSSSSAVKNSSLLSFGDDENL